MNQTYVEYVKREVRKWESESPGLLTNVVDVMLLPAGRLIRTVIPSRAQKAVGKGIYELLLKLNSASELLIHEERIIRRVDREYVRCHDELKASDVAARHYRRRSTAYAIGEGTAASAVGPAGFIGDVAVLVALAIRLIRQIGTCYGYDMTSEKEAAHTLHVLRLGSSTSLKAKMEYLSGLAELQQVLVRLTVTSAAERFTTSHLGALSASATVRHFAEKIGTQLTARKTMTWVPVVGAVIGGSCNAMFLNDVGRAAYMAFRRRRILEIEQADASLALG